MAIVTLLSGGLDSAVMSKVFADEGERQFPLFVDYGQRNLEREWYAAHALARKLELGPLERIAFADYGRLVPSGLTHKELDVTVHAYLPGRNSLFLLLASAYAVTKRCNKVAIGLLSDEFAIFPDQTSNFVRKFESLLAFSVGEPIQILAPLMMLTKRQVITIAEQLDITDTYSCHAGSEQPCGVCIACREFNS